MPASDSYSTQIPMAGRVRSKEFLKMPFRIPMVNVLDARWGSEPVMWRYQDQVRVNLFGLREQGLRGQSRFDPLSQLGKPSRLHIVLRLRGIEFRLGGRRSHCRSCLQTPQGQQELQGPTVVEPRSLWKTEWCAAMSDRRPIQVALSGSSSWYFRT